MDAEPSPRPLVGIASLHQSAHLAVMIKRATKRPEGFVKPPHWSNEPVPEPKASKDDEELSPTRYGDWVKDGIAIDF